MPARLQKTSTLICFILGILFFSKGYCQSLAIAYGPSLPMGNYASKDIDFTNIKSNHGLALNGYHLSITLEENKHRKFFSPFFQFTLNQNKMDEAALDKYAMATRNLNTLNNLSLQGIQVTSAWSQQIIMLGGKMNFFSNGFDLFAKAGLGFGWFHSATMNYYFDSLYKMKQAPASANALCYLIGVGGNIAINQQYSIHFGADFMGAKPNYGDYTFQLDNGNKVLIKPVPPPNKIPFSALLISFGLKFYLQKADALPKKF